MKKSVYVKSVLILSYLLFCIQIAVAQSPQNVSAQEAYRIGKNLYDNDKYNEGIPWLQSAADRRYAYAYRYLASCYYHTNNKDKAFDYYSKALDHPKETGNGLAFCYYMVGNYMLYGLGVISKDPEKAIFCFEKAIEYSYMTGRINEERYQSKLKEARAALQNNNSNSSYVSNTNTTNNQQPTTIRTSNPNGGYTEVTRYPDGKVVTVMVTHCSMCNGRKVCTTCWGNRVRYFNGSVYPCVCHGTGLCDFCKGAGEARYTYTSYSNGQVQGSTPWGETFEGDKNSVKSSNGKTYYTGQSSNDKKNYSEPSRSSCPRCGGRRYEPTKYSNCAPSTSGSMQPISNRAGDRCAICGDNTQHCHYPCSDCQGYGTVKN